MNNSNQRGISHAPGVKCIVAVPPSEVKYNSKILLNNGRIVRLIRLINFGARWYCGCGDFILMDVSKVWEFEILPGDPLLHIVCTNVTGLTHKELEKQSCLIPISDDDLEQQLSAEHNKTTVFDMSKPNKQGVNV